MSNIKINFLFISLGLLFLSFSEIKIQEVEKEGSPGARWGHVLIYHNTSGNILLFGGKNKQSGQFLNDTWIWEGKEWKKIDVPGPSARGFCAITFHKVRNTILLHGGRGNDGVTYSDLWEWNGTNWYQIEKNSSFKADHHQIVYLEDQNKILAFGGWNGENINGDTWLWFDKWEQLEIPSPPKRGAFSMVYNKKENNVILFGGLWLNGQYADLWKWSDKEWLPMGGPYDNSSLDHHSMIFDTRLQQIIGFGGKNYRYVCQNKTFKIENNKIVVFNTEGPPARHSFGFTFDVSTKYGYLYGGKEYVNNKQLALDDFWRWDGKKWNRIPLTKAKKH